MVQRRRSKLVPVSEAKVLLTELVRRAEAGDEVILTRHGRPAARIVPVAGPQDPDTRRRIMLRLRDAAKPLVNASSAESQDFLYDEDGLPA